MKLPGPAKKLIKRQLIGIAIQGYRQGREDTNNDRYDEEAFKENMKELIAGQV
jgi:hypothetical protein